MRATLISTPDETLLVVPEQPAGQGAAGEPQPARAPPRDAGSRSRCAYGSDLARVRQLMVQAAPRASPHVDTTAQPPVAVVRGSATSRV